MTHPIIPKLLSAVWVSLLTLLLSVEPAAAADIKLEIQLIWGTNEEASSDASHTPVESVVAKKLSMFKWKNYFRVSRQEVVVPSRSSKRIALSKKCEIEIKELEGPRIEVNVYGQGKHVKKITENISKQNSLTIAGDDKNDCAWFIVIKEL